MNQKKDSSQRSSIERKTARKIPVADIVKGTYIKRPGWEPSGVLTKYGEITRVNIIGLIVSKENTENSSSYLLDDGTGNISIRLFENPHTAYEVGDFVNIIGRVREGQNSIFVVPEIMKKADKRWHRYHNLELKLLKQTAKQLPVEQDDEDEDFETGPYQKILNVISVLDQGTGVDVQEIVSNIKIKDCDSIIQNLIEEGEIFEVSPGRVKLLE